MFSFLVCLFLKSCLNDNDIKEFSKKEISDLLYLYERVVNIELLTEIIFYSMFLYYKSLERFYL